MRFEHVVTHSVRETGLLEDMWQTWEPMAKAKAKRKLRDLNSEV